MTVGWIGARLRMDSVGHANTLGYHWRQQTKRHWLFLRTDNHCPYHRNDFCSASSVSPSHKLARQATTSPSLRYESPSSVSGVQR